MPGDEELRSWPFYFSKNGCLEMGGLGTSPVGDLRVTSSKSIDGTTNDTTGAAAAATCTSNQYHLICQKHCVLRAAEIAQLPEWGNKPHFWPFQAIGALKFGLHSL